MADKLSTLPRTKLGRRIGVLAEPDMRRLEHAVLLFLGFARKQDACPRAAAVPHLD